MTRLLSIFCLSFTLLMVAPIPSAQAETAEYTSYLRELSDVNNINLMRSPRFDRQSEILDNKIVDNRNKVVGTLKDVIVRENGSISALNVEFDRLHLRNDVRVRMSALGIRPANNAFIVGYDADQIEDIYPSLLADITPASGPGAEDGLGRGLSRIVGADLRDFDGKKLGRVSDVLFARAGSSAMALQVKLGRKSVSIPFASIRFSSKKGNDAIYLSNDRASALREFVR